MFKTDKKSLEKISFEFDERNLANFRDTLKRMKSSDLLTITDSEYNRMINGLDAVGKLKLDGKIYGFHVHDSCAMLQGSDGEGVELYLRQGDELNCIYSPCDRDHVCSLGRRHVLEDISGLLKDYNISTIYTGPMPPVSGFLGLSQDLDPEHPITYSIFNDNEINLLTSKGISVIKLDHLI